MEPRSDIIDSGVIGPTKEIFDIDIFVYKDLLEASKYLRCEELGRIPIHQITALLSEIKGSRILAVKLCYNLIET